jgi:hypothetical protein
MPLYERLGGSVEPKIPVHTFMAAADEYLAGKMTRGQVINAFALDAGEQAELDTLAARMQPLPEFLSLGGYTVLTNVGAAYDATGPSKGLGFARLDAAGVSGVEFSVYYSKVGTGVLSWQLWDDTGAVEVARIDEAAGEPAGDKLKTATRSFVPLPPGSRALRVRVKSTVAADDPVYYGASVRLLRSDVVLGEVLHRVLLLAEAGVPPLDTPAAVRARLGV